MPCFDNQPHEPSREEVLARKMPAVLCAILRCHTVNELRAMFARINWKDAGVTPEEVDEWWRLHNANDRERAAREREQRERDRVRAKALAKLTPAERRELGL